MPFIPKIERAKLQEVEWDEQGDASLVDRGVRLDVQFNPETLRVSYTNQRPQNDQPGAASVQSVGAQTTKLSVELVFDVSAPQPPTLEGNVPTDVRRLTRLLAQFMIPKEDGDNFVQRGARFHWGSFLMEGVMTSMTETLELFSPEGKPLRAVVGIELSEQKIRDFSADASGDRRGVGTAPIVPVPAGQSIQQIAGQQGQPAAWRELADAAGVESGRLPPPGTQIELPNGR